LLNIRFGLSGDYGMKDVLRKTVQSLMVIVVLAAAGLGVRVLTAGGMRSEQSATRMIMGTFANVTAVGRGEARIQKSFRAAFDRLSEVDEGMSDYLSESELSQLNEHGYEGPVKVSEGLFEVIKAAVEYSRISDGAFDVTVGPEVRLWRRTEKEGKAPTEAELAEAKAKTGYEKLILDEKERTVRFAVEGMVLDLGGIAKGYAIDLAVEAMKEAGVAGGLVNVGGDIRCFGRSPKGDNIWRIGLEDPAGTSDMLEVLEVADMAVATSGDYRRFVMIDNKRYSHIINPHTTKSADELTSVTIIAPSAIQADALATAVSVAGAKKGLEMVEGIEGVEAIVIPAGKELRFEQTSGAGAFVKK